MIRIQVQIQIHEDQPDGPTLIFETTNEQTVTAIKDAIRKEVIETRDKGEVVGDESTIRKVFGEIN